MEYKRDRMDAHTRREFLRGTVAFGGLMAVSNIACVSRPREMAANDFAARGRWERLTIALAHIDAGATEPFSILHISDTHFTAVYDHESETKRELKRIRTRTFGGMQEQAFADSLAWAKDHVDYVVHTGDLIDFQSEANFDLVKKHFKGDGVFGALGNHEYSRNMWFDKEKESPAYCAATRDLIAAAFPFKPVFASSVVNGVNFVSMDDVYGTVTTEQTKLFAAEVAKGLPIILCLHVPFYSPSIYRADKKFWTKEGVKFRSAALPDLSGDYKAQVEDPVTRDFIAALRKEPLLKGILAGHLHITFQDRFSPTAMQYLVGGNFLFHGREITIS